MFIDEWEEGPVWVWVARGDFVVVVVPEVVVGDTQWDNRNEGRELGMNRWRRSGSWHRRKQFSQRSCLSNRRRHWKERERIAPQANRLLLGMGSRWKPLLGVEQENHMNILESESGRGVQRGWARAAPGWRSFRAEAGSHWPWALSGGWQRAGKDQPRSSLDLGGQRGRSQTWGPDSETEKLEGRTWWWSRPPPALRASWRGHPGGGAVPASVGSDIRNLRPREEQVLLPFLYPNAALRSQYGTRTVLMDTPASPMG